MEAALRWLFRPGDPSFITLHAVHSLTPLLLRPSHLPPPPPSTAIVYRCWVSVCVLLLCNALPVAVPQPWSLSLPWVSLNPSRPPPAGAD